MLRGVNEPFDGVQPGAGISTHHGGTGVGEGWGGCRQTERGRLLVFGVTLGLLKDLRGPS